MAASYLFQNFLPERSNHMRELPSTLDAFSSRTGKRRLAEAMADGMAEAYFPLTEQFITQSEITYCGLASLTMCMNALHIFTDTSAAGWQWWEDEMFLQSIAPSTSGAGDLERLKTVGITLDQFEELAVANGADVTVRRPTDPRESLAAFRASLIESAQMQTQAFTVVSFCRQRLGQTGSGHFSPIGGYHAASDSVLVLDVARFKYPPYWVSVPDLWEACSATDDATGQARGWCTLSLGALSRTETR